MSIPANTIQKWLLPVTAVGILGGFFLAWANWQGIHLNGAALPAGRFFSVSAEKFGLENPFPQFSFAFYIFWLIPVGALAVLALALREKTISIIPFITGALTLSLAAVFFFFSQKLNMLGVGNSPWPMLQPGIWLASLSAIAMIVLTPASYAMLKKPVWIIIGPLFVFISFMLMEKYLMNKTFGDTSDIKADFTINAPELINDFTVNDSAANLKYREKIINVRGAASEVEMLADSTVNIKFADSTGSYIVFPIGKELYKQASVLKAGDSVSLKGSCSGSVFSEILGTTSISFKRTTIIK